MIDHADRHIWEFPWVRDLLILAAAAMVVFGAYAARSIVAPALLGLVLAYATNPLVKWMSIRWRIRRSSATALLMGAAAATGLIFLAWLLPLLTKQLLLLIRNTAAYVSWLAERTAPQWRPYLQLLRERVTALRQGTPATDAPNSAPVAGAAASGESEPATGVESDAEQTPAGGAAGGESEAETGGAEAGGADVDNSMAPKPETEAGVEALDEASETAGNASPRAELVLEGQPATGDGGGDLHASGEQPIDQLYHGLGGLNFSAIGSALLDTLDIGLRFAGSTFSIALYAVLFLVITGFCFYVFSSNLPRIRNWLASLIPHRARPRTIELANKMDRSVCAFIRGRLIQAFVMACVLSLGWWIVGVPYWLLLGVAGGVLNLAPFVAVFAWVAALAIHTIDQLSGGGGWSLGIFLWPTLIYAIAQFLDGWVVEPVVQGKATNLDPLTVLLAVLIGGTLAGMLGLIAAIPLAACVKILLADLLLPMYRAWADGRPAPSAQSIQTDPRGPK